MEAYCAWFGFCTGEPNLVAWKSHPVCGVKTKRLALAARRAKKKKTAKNHFSLQDLQVHARRRTCCRSILYATGSGIDCLEKAHQRLTTKTSIIWIEQRLWMTSREHVSSTWSPSTAMTAGVSTLKVTLRALRAFLSMTSCLPSTSISNSLGKKWTQKRNFPSSLANCWPSSEGPYAWLFTSSASSIFAIGLRRLVNLQILSRQKHSNMRNGIRKSLFTTASKSLTLSNLETFRLMRHFGPCLKSNLHV